MRVFFLLVAVAACGGSSPPITPPHTDTDTDASAPIPTTSSSATSVPTTSTAPTTSAAPTASAAPTTSSGPPVVDEGLMACGNVQMAFEQKVRPETKKCFFEAKVKNPKLTGNVKIVINVNLKGEVTAINIVDKKELGDAAVACMTKAVKDAKFDGSQCKGKTVEMAQAFGAAAK